MLSFDLVFKKKKTFRGLSLLIDVKEMARVVRGTPKASKQMFTNARSSWSPITTKVYNVACVKWIFRALFNRCSNLNQAVIVFL